LVDAALEAFNLMTEALQLLDRSSIIGADIAACHLQLTIDVLHTAIRTAREDYGEG
jgi:hypothetical protein